MKVMIDFTLRKSKLEVYIQDAGSGFAPDAVNQPNIKEKIEGEDKKKRGWGMYIIKHMVDEMEYLNVENGTQLKIVLSLPSRKVSPR